MTLGGSKRCKEDCKRDNQCRKWRRATKSRIRNQSSAMIPVLGITGTGGAGKSSVTDEIVRRFLNNFTDKTIAVISVDPSKKKTGGALLGDRIRMNSISHPRAYMRSLATREDNTALSRMYRKPSIFVKTAAFDFIILGKCRCWTK